MLGVVVCLFWLLPLIGGLFSEHDESNGEGVVLASLVILAMVATALSFRFGQAPAWVVVMCGLALSVFAVVTAGRNQWLAVLVAGVPWIVVGALFVAADRLGGEIG